MEPVLHKNLKNHSIWGSSSKIYLLAGSMVQVYEQVYIYLEYTLVFMSICITSKALSLILTCIDIQAFFSCCVLGLLTRV